MSDEPQRSDPVKAVLQLAGLLAGALALLYALGGGVLALRLFFEGLPSLTVVGQLPREFLISLALTQVALPTAAVAALYLTIRLVVGLPPPRRLVARERKSLADWAPFAGAALVLAVLATSIGAATGIRKRHEDWFVAWVLVELAFTMVVALAALELRARLVARHAEGWDEPRAVAAMTGVVALAFLPAWIMAAGTFHLLEAKACLAGDAVEAGVLVGETSDRAYIGEVRETGSKRVVSLPTGQVEELFIGGDAAARPCALPDEEPDETG